MTGEVPSSRPSPSPSSPEDKAVLSLEGLKQEEARRRLERGELLRKENLETIREGLTILKSNQAQIQTEAFYKGIEKGADSLITELADIIFDLPEFNAEGIKIFNQMVARGESIALAVRLVSGFQFLRRCENSAAPTDCLEQILLALSNLEELPTLSVLQASPGVVRYYFSLHGKAQTWETRGTLNRSASTLPQSSSPVSQPQTQRSSADSGTHSEQEAVDEEAIEERKKLWVNLSQDFSKDAWAKLKEVVLEDSYPERLAPESGGDPQLVHLFNPAEKERVAALSDSEFKKFFTGKYLDTLAKENPDFFMDMQP